MRWLLGLLVTLAGLPALAEEVVLGLSSDTVAISTDFDGSDILIYGAVKREAPIAEAPLQVIVTVSGPFQPLTVRRKERRFGIWINTDSVFVDAAPSFYAVATSAPWDEVISDTEDLRHRISIPRAIRSVGAPETVPDAQSFTEAVIRVRTDEGTYKVLESSVGVREQTLFDTSIQLPANLTEGTYNTRVYLTRDRAVVSSFATTIEVRKVGLERWLHALSRQQPLVYGLMSLALAIAAGWGASAAFRAIRQQ